MSEPTAGEHADNAEAALESVQPDRLLSGEDEGTSYLDDARHWLHVYTELLAFKVDVLGVTEERVRAMDPDSAAEVKQTDFKVLRTEAERFERRLHYWRERVTALETQG